MEFQSTINALLGILILGSGLFAMYEGAHIGKKRFKYKRKIQSNRKLIQENKTLKTILDQSQKEVKMGSWQLDIPRDIMTWSDEMYAIYGLSKKLGQSQYTATQLFKLVEDLILEADRSIFKGLTHKSLKGIPTKRIEYRIRTSAGEIKNLVSSVESVIGHDKRTIRLMGTVQDITQQKEISRSLFQEKKKYHLLADNLPVGIFRSNIEGELLFVNQAMVDMFGYDSEDDLAGQNSFTLYDNPSDRANLLHELNTSGKLTDYQMVFKKKDGTTFIGEQNSLMEGNELHGIIQDITDRVKFESEKNALIDKLKNQNTDLEEFAFIISHNLRSPLSNVMGLTKIFDKSSASSDNLEIMSLIEQSTVNLDLIIRDLNQTLTVRESDKKRRENIDVHQLLQSILSEYAPIIEGNTIEISTNISEGDEIKSVKSFVENIIKHLLDNSIKFRKPDQPSQITIDLHQMDTHFELTVSDNGIGIDLDENANRLFLIYEKLDGNIEGRGLGLYLVKNHINALNGSIHVESQPNQGAKFIVQLPKIS